MWYATSRILTYFSFLKSPKSEEVLGKISGRYVGLRGSVHDAQNRSSRTRNCTSIVVCKWVPTRGNSTLQRDSIVLVRPRKRGRTGIVLLILPPAWDADSHAQQAVRPGGKNKEKELVFSAKFHIMDHGRQVVMPNHGIWPLRGRAVVAV